MTTLRIALLGSLALAALVMLAGALRIDREWYEVHVLVARCAVFPSEVAGAGRLRVLLGVLGAVFLAVLYPLDRLLVRAARAAKGRVSRGAVLRVGLAVVLALVVSELVLRRKTHAGQGLTRPDIAVPPTHGDARLGWAFDAPRTTVLDADGRAIPYVIDADGDRVGAEGERPDPSRPTLLFAGESVTYGLGVRWEETYPALAGKALGVQVVTAAVHGYGDDQIHLAMLDHLAKLERPIAVVTLAMADLLERDVATWRDRLVVGEGGALVTVRAQPELLRESPLVALVERVKPWEDDASLRLARAVFVATDRAAKARGARALFLLTNFLQPCLPDASGRPSIEARLFDGLPVDHVRVDLDPAWLVKSEGHPDTRAHARLAEGVVAALRERGVSLRVDDAVTAPR
jgi:hypothetical protein